MSPVIRSSGNTDSERLLASLAERAFLNLWSYPNVYRDQGKRGNGDGKEFCDVLVVCGDHIVLFSDKTIAFRDTGKMDVDWARWHRRAILKSADQLWGAERWLDSPQRLYLDPQCTRAFPIALPPRERRRVHLVVVARGAGEACKKWFGEGTGSLMICPGLASKRHVNSKDPSTLPFVIGDLDSKRSFVHVLDDATLELLLGELNTITDFVSYLDKKEQFVRSGHLLSAGGEDDLLSYYVMRMDRNGDHNFTSPSGGDWKAMEAIVLNHGQWAVTQSNPQYVAKKKADEISKLWDGLINAFTSHMLAGTTITTVNFENEEGGSREFDVATYERAVRYMALESRFRRRILSINIYEAMETATETLRHVRIVGPGPGPADSTPYVFLQYPRRTDVDYATYRKHRRITLYGYCLAVKSDHPEWKRVVGIATEPAKYNKDRPGSEDLLLVELDKWTPELQSEADHLRSTLNIMQKETLQFSRFQASEYPEVSRSTRAERRREAKRERKEAKHRRKF